MSELVVGADLGTNEMWLSQFGPTDNFFNTTYRIISSDRCLVKQAGLKTNCTKCKKNLLV